MSFRLKLILGVALIEALLLALLMVGVVGHFREFGQQLLEDYARVKAQDAALQVKQALGEGDAPRLAALADSLLGDPDLAYVRILDPAGQLLAMAGQPSPAQAPRSGASGVVAMAVDVPGPNRPLGRVEVGVGTARAERAFALLEGRIWMVMAVGMGLVAAFSLGLGLYLSRRLKGLEEGARRLGQGELGFQVEVRGRDELAAVAESFNAMSRQMLRDSQMQADFQHLLQSREGDERRKLEARLEERSAALVEAGLEFRRLMENLPAYVIRYDRDGRAIYVSPRFDEVIQAGGASLVGKRPAEMAVGAGADLARFQAALERVLGTAASEEVELEVEERTGRRLHQVRLVAERDAEGRIQGALAVGLDITERRHGEARLALLSFAMDRVTEAAMIIDEQAHIRYANKGASAMLGIPAEDLGTLTMADLRQRFDPAEWARHWAELREKGSLVYETLNRHRDGRVFPVEVNANYFEVEGVGYDLALGRDVTQRKRLEEAQVAALAEAERLASAKSDFLANMSHELRTPLHVMLGMAQLGLRTSREEQSRGRFATIQDTGQLMLALVDDILDFSKIEAGKLAVERDHLSLGPALDRAVELTAPRARAKGLRFRVREAPDLPEGFQGDGLRLVQVLINLLSNAVKFTEAGEVILEVEREAGALRFTVTDTGIGMDPARLGRLFIPFEQGDGSTTRRYGGTGLGLAISKRLMDLMGGDIEARGEPGRGMRFRVRLPVSGMGTRAAPTTQARVRLSASLDDMNELLVELRRWGMDAATLPAAEALAVADALVILAPADLRGLDAVPPRPAAGGRLALLADPVGGEPAGAVWLDQVAVLDWPLRARHVFALARDAGALRAAPASSSRKGRLEGVRILVAEDDAMNRVILEELLALEGARVESVGNGRLLLERFQGGPGDFDIIIADVQMPEMDGNEAARRITAQDPDMPIIGLTARVMADEQARCLASGMVAHVGKPAQMDQLIGVIRENLPLGRARPA